MRKYRLLMALVIAPFALGAALAEDDLDVTMGVVEEDATEERVSRELTLPGSASEQGREQSRPGRETAGEARERGRDFGQERAEEARERGRESGGGRSEEARERGREASQGRSETGRDRADEARGSQARPAD